MAELILTPAELRHWAKLAEQERSPHVAVRVHGVYEVLPEVPVQFVVGLGPSESGPLPRNPFLG